MVKWVKSIFARVLTIGLTGDLEGDMTEQIYSFMVSTLAFVFSTFALHYLFQGLLKLAALQVVVVCVSLISYWIFRKTKSPTKAASFILLFGSASAYFRTYLMGGIYSPALFIWPIVPLMTSVLMPALYSGFWTMVYVGIALYFHFQEVAGVKYDSVATPETAESVRIIAICFIQFIVFLVGNYTKNTNRRYREFITKQKEEKTNLLRVLSHDIAGPLQILRLSVDLQARQKGSTPETVKMTRAITSIESILGHVRDLEAVVSGKKELTLEAVDLTEVVQEATFLQADNLKAKEIMLRVNIPESDTSYVVLAEKRGLTYQVVNNLLSNAIKFTPVGGSIEIDVTANTSGIALKVRDTGIGIPLEMRHHLFESGKHTTRMGTGGETGTGFGMPIVKAYVEKFHGKISVDSVTSDENPKDHGTTVTVEIPKKAA